MTDPFPNPVRNPGDESSFNVTVPGSSTVTWSVYTLAFRKICSYTESIPAGTKTFHWDLRDKQGTKVSNDLYYIRVQVTGVQSKVYTLKALIQL